MARYYTIRVIISSYLCNRLFIAALILVWGFVLFVFAKYLVRKTGKL